MTRAHYAVFLSRALNKPGLPKAKYNVNERRHNQFNPRLPYTLEATLYDYKYRGKQFSAVRTELLKNATQPFTDDLLKKYYAQMCTECDGLLFTRISDERIIVLKFLKIHQTKVRISTIAFDIPGPNAAGKFLGYSFEKQAGKWKLSAYDWEPIGARSFNLTKKKREFKL